MPTEKSLQAKICKFARSLGILAYKFESPSQRGVPDLLMVFPTGAVMFLEVKSPTGRGQLSKLQEIQLRKLTENNADAHVTESFDHARSLILDRLDPGASGRD